MNNLILYEGKVLSSKELPFSTFYERLLEGDGVFTSLKVRDGVIENFSAHKKRLLAAAERLYLDVEELSDSAFFEYLKKNDALKGIWKMKISLIPLEPFLVRLKKGGGGCRSLVQLHPLEENFSPMTLGIYPYPIEHPLASVKSHSYLGRQLLKEYAWKHGWDDVMTTNREGILLELSTSNFFALIGKEMWVNKEDVDLLTGTTLPVLAKILQKRGFSLEKRACTLKELPSEAMLFACNALHTIRPIMKIGEKTFSSESVRLAQEVFSAFLSVSAALSDND